MAARRFGTRHLRLWLVVATLLSIFWGLMLHPPLDSNGSSSYSFSDPALMIEQYLNSGSGSGSSSDKNAKELNKNNNEDNKQQTATSTINIRGLPSTLSLQDLPSWIIDYIRFHNSTLEPDPAYERLIKANKIPRKGASPYRLKKGLYYLKHTGRSGGSGDRIGSIICSALVAFCLNRTLLVDAHWKPSIFDVFPPHFLHWNAKNQGPTSADFKRKDSNNKVIIDNNNEVTVVGGSAKDIIAKVIRVPQRRVVGIEVNMPNCFAYDPTLFADSQCIQQRILESSKEERAKLVVETSSSSTNNDNNATSLMVKRREEGQFRRNHFTLPKPYMGDDGVDVDQTAFYYYWFWTLFHIGPNVKTRALELLQMAGIIPSRTNDTTTSTTAAKTADDVTTTANNNTSTPFFIAVHIRTGDSHFFMRSWRHNGTDVPRRFYDCTKLMQGEIAKRKCLEGDDLAPIYIASDNPKTKKEFQSFENENNSSSGGSAKTIKMVESMEIMHIDRSHWHDYKKPEQAALDVWAEFQVLSIAPCLIHSRSGFSEVAAWTGSKPRCSVRFDECSVENVNQALVNIGCTG